MSDVDDDFMVDEEEDYDFVRAIGLPPTVSNNYGFVRIIQKTATASQQSTWRTSTTTARLSKKMIHKQRLPVSKR